MNMIRINKMNNLKNVSINIYSYKYNRILQNSSNILLIHTIKYTKNYNVITVE